MKVLNIIRKRPFGVFLFLFLLLLLVSITFLFFKSNGFYETRQIDTFMDYSRKNAAMAVKRLKKEMGFLLGECTELSDSGEKDTVFTRLDLLGGYFKYCEIYSRELSEPYVFLHKSRKIALHSPFETKDLNNILKRPSGVKTSEIFFIDQAAYINLYCPGKSREIFLRLNMTAAVSEIVSNISAWKPSTFFAVDEKGTFIYHDQPDYIGNNVETLSQSDGLKKLYETLLTDKKGSREYSYEADDQIERNEITGWKSVSFGTDRIILAMTFSTADYLNHFKIINEINYLLILLFALSAILLCWLCFRKRTQKISTNRDYLKNELRKKTVKIREGEEVFKIFIENNPDLFIQVDISHKINFVSSSVEKLLGLKKKDLLNQNILHMLLNKTDISKEDYDKLLNPETYHSFRLKAKNIDGRPVYFEASIIKSHLKNPKNYYQFIGRDITKSVLDEIRLQNLSDFRKELIELSTWILNKNDDHTSFDRLMESSIRFVENAEKGTLLLKGDDDYYHIVASYGYDRQKLQRIKIHESEWFDLNSKAVCHLNQFKKLSTPTNGNEENQTYSEFSRIKSVISSPIIINDEVIGRLTMDNFTAENGFTDEDLQTLSLITQQLTLFLGKKQYEIDLLKEKNQLYHMVMYDHLTNIPNRRYTEKHFVELVKVTESKLAIMYTNIKKFRDLNGTFGRFACDNLLIQIADRLKACTDPDDFISRFESDEFILIIPFSDKQKLSEKITLIKNELELPFVLNDKSVVLNFRTGVSIAPDDDLNLENLLKFASTAASLNFETGMDITFFKKIQLDIISEKTLIEQNLLHDLDQDTQNFEIYYQPCVDTQTGKIRHLEALLRWKSDGQFIPPSKFIPIAEESALIHKIGKLVLDRVLRQMKDWKAAGMLLPVSINLSAKDIRHPEMPRIIQNALRKHDIPVNMLGIELTERALITDMDNSIRNFELLKKMGISLLIDDFGTGYSSLSCLNKFPIDFIKIDKSFIDDVCDSEKNQAIVKTVISLSKSLNAKTIAEGVETTEQLNYLKENNCDMIQGYLFSKPLNKSAIEKILPSGN